jgi:2-polyprenyl-3-methyl-5-hydroxy-6-metoxy-1,4-benzoquinol methylase
VGESARTVTSLEVREGYDATRSQIGDGPAAVQPTVEAIRRRYRDNRDWQLFPKEYMFHFIAKDGAGGKRVLDLGCGTGEISTQLAFLGARVVGIDVDPGLIEVSQRRAELDDVADRCEFLLGDLPSLIAGGRLGRFDHIVCYAVLHHFDFQSQFDLLMDCLVPGGTIFIAEPIAFSPALQRLRDGSSVPKMDLDPGERQLGQDDIRFILNRVEPQEIRFVYLLGRLARIFPGTARPFAIVDRWTLRLFPFLRRFSGEIVIRAGSRSSL